MCHINICGAIYSNRESRFGKWKKVEHPFSFPEIGERHFCFVWWLVGLSHIRSDRIAAHRTLSFAISIPLVVCVCMLTTLTVAMPALHSSILECSSFILPEMVRHGILIENVKIWIWTTLLLCGKTKTLNTNGTRRCSLARVRYPPRTLCELRNISKSGTLIEMDQSNSHTAFCESVEPFCGFVYYFAILWSSANELGKCTRKFTQDML